MKNKMKSIHKKQRIAIIDLIRALNIISMVCYHTVWDIVNIFNTDLKWYGEIEGYVWQQSICWTFIFLSGFCLPLGRNPLKRGITVFAVGMLVSAATVLFMPQERIVFGILTLIGSCMIITALLDEKLKKANPSIGFMICTLLFILTRNINRGFLGFENFNIMPTLPLPEFLYNGLIATFLGFTDRDFVSSDYFSLMPWIFLFLSGYYAKNLIKEIKYDIKIPSAVSFIAKNSLIIYILHQPVVYSVLVFIYSFIR